MATPNQNAQSNQSSFKTKEDPTLRKQRDSEEPLLAVEGEDAVIDPRYAESIRTISERNAFLRNHAQRTADYLSKLIPIPEKQVAKPNIVEEAETA